VDELSNLLTSPAVTLARSCSYTPSSLCGFPGIGPHLGALKGGERFTLTGTDAWSALCATDQAAAQVFQARYSWRVAEESVFVRDPATATLTGPALFDLTLR
jgi:hypothetical protein